MCQEVRHITEREGALGTNVALERNLSMVGSARHLEWMVTLDEARAVGRGGRVWLQAAVSGKCKGLGS